MRNTEYGSAANGRQVGSGFDVEIKRTGENTALVCVTSLRTKDEWMMALDVDPDTDMQARAIEIARCPDLGNEGWIPDSEWDQNLVARWNAAEVGRWVWIQMSREG